MNGEDPQSFSKDLPFDQGLSAVIQPLKFRSLVSSKHDRAKMLFLLRMAVKVGSSRLTQPGHEIYFKYTCKACAISMHYISHSRETVLLK